ncbi:MAG TPA: CRTAC1 family protein [Bryobacteraceae bacterium]|nr:CRTAC1 family protein [Bryobacteraceae bacterium]
MGFRRIRLFSLAALVIIVPILFTAASSSQPASTAPVFNEITKEAGINFVHLKGNKGVANIMEEAGPGVCVADFDGDGWPDIYFANTRDLYGRGIKARNALYRNNRDGTFTDVTEAAGVPGNAFGLGCVWGDYDNDGWPDLYVTQYGKNILYRNNGNGTFTDVTAKAGVDGMDFGTMLHLAATFFDYDRDGRLDLFAGGYVEFGPSAKQTCEINGAESSCPPSAYHGTAAVLYHNNGDGTFTNVTKTAKMYQPGGKILAALASDYDNDGWPDLFVANDGMEIYLYHNERNGTFNETGLTAGVALTEDGGTMAAMCLSVGDYDNDGLLDLYASDFQDAPHHLWRNRGEGQFEEVSRQVRIGEITAHFLSFGGGFFDYDNDGWVDLFIANGHVYQGVEQSTAHGHYKQINLLFHNERNGKFENVTGQAVGNGFSTPRLGRGAAFADFFNDGHEDVVVGNNDDPPTLLRNRSGGSNHFVSFKLVGVRSNRDALGSRIRIKTGGVDQIREIAAGGSYMSHNDLRAHFGLGSSKQIENVEVTWPNGSKQNFHDVKADQFYVLEEGKDALKPQVIAHRK